eukprot:905103-Amorphochlora_amoeboformis.AAC.2
MLLLHGETLRILQAYLRFISFLSSGASCWLLPWLGSKLCSSLPQLESQGLPNMYATYMHIHKLDHDLTQAPALSYLTTNAIFAHIFAR